MCKNNVGKSLICIELFYFLFHEMSALMETHVMATEEIPEQAGPVADEAIVSQLLDIGFSKVRCEKAAIQTLNTGVEEAMNWLLAHMDDPG